MRTIAVFLALTLAAPLAAIEKGQKGATMADAGETNADSLLAAADTVFQKRDYPAALKEYSSLLEIARHEFNRPVEVEALAQIARLNLLTGKKEEGRRFLDEAAARASDSDPLGWSRYLGVRGRFEWKDDDLPRARKTFDDMYVYCNTNALWSRAVDAAHMIAIVSETPEEQIEWSKRGLEAAEAGGVESWLAALWNNLGATYYDNKQLDLALEAFLKAREFHWRFSGESGKLYADYHVGMTLRALGQLDEAAKWLRPVLAWAERLGDHSAIGQACEDLGEVALAQGHPVDGLALLKRAREQYKQAGFDKTWKAVWDGINQRIGEVEGK